MSTETVGRVFARVKKIELDIGFDDWDALPIDSRRFLAHYGWKQWSADSHAGDKRDLFPTGNAGTEAWKDKVLEHVMERHTVIVTGVGLPGSAKPNVVAELAAKLEEKDKALTEKDGQLAAAMARIAEFEAASRKKAA